MTRRRATDERASAKRGNWSANDLGRLRDLFPRARTVDVARLLRRSEAAVRRRAAELFAGPLRRGAFEPGDVEKLREGYGALDPKDLALVLGRTQRDVKRQIEVLRGQRRSGPWSAVELRRLKRLYGTRTNDDLVVCLSRPRDEIEAEAKRLCLRKDKRLLAGRVEREVGRRVVLQPMPRWDDASVDLLRRMYPDADNLDIARRLGRTVTGVANKAHQLGLRKSPAALARMGRKNVEMRHRPKQPLATDLRR